MTSFSVAIFLLSIHPNSWTLCWAEVNYIYSLNKLINNLWIFSFRFNNCFLQGKGVIVIRKNWHLFLFLILILFQLLFAYSFCLAYGIITLIFGPFTTWVIGMEIYLWIMTSRLNEHDFTKATEFSKQFKKSERNT